MRTAVVFGGYGVFGSLVARELVKRSVPVIVAGRDLARAERFAAEIGGRGVRADATDPPLDLVTPEHVVVNCAGPFSGLGSRLVLACAERGVHHVDLADDRRWAAHIRALGPRLERSAAAYGCSSLPGISLALASTIERPGTERARVTLFIGNDNPKGAAAIRSLVAGLGKEIRAPQGALSGFGHGETVRLPFFGARRVYDFESPEYDLLAAPSVSVKVGFELRLATRAFALLARLSSSWGERTAGLLAALGGPRWGSSGGVVQVELSGAGWTSRASLGAREHGQRMAALPCALVAAELARGREARGALTAPALFGARALLDALVAEGCELDVLTSE
jgi:hypothetical protein